MQDRNQYTQVDDFLADDSFKEWILKGADTHEWEEWTLENTERARLVAEARIWLLSLGVPEVSISNQEVEKALQYTWSKIEYTEVETSIYQKIKQSQVFRYAAGIAVLILLGLVWMQKAGLFIQAGQSTLAQASTALDESGFIEQINHTTKSQLIVLSDGSSVLLQPDSKLSYPKEFNEEERVVLLEGEGFFEISKDPQKPFKVFSKGMVTQVYGTSFRVIAYPNQKGVEVLVKTGKVRLYSERNQTLDDAHQVELIANQAAQFDTDKDVFKKWLLSDTPNVEPEVGVIAPIEAYNFEFKDQSLKTIFSTIEDAYAVKIQFPEKELKDCFLTTSLSDEPLPEKLKIICETLGNNTSYEMNGPIIKINSTGCN